MVYKVCIVNEFVWLLYNELKIDGGVIDCENWENVIKRKTQKKTIFTFVERVKRKNRRKNRIQDIFFFCFVFEWRSE